MVKDRDAMLCGLFDTDQSNFCEQLASALQMRIDRNNVNR
jgi:hypothetical protein